MIPLFRRWQHPRRARLDSVLDVRAPGAAHPDQALLVHDVDARLAVPEQIDSRIDQAATEVDHPLAADSEGVVAHREVDDAVLLAQQPDLVDHVLSRAEAQPRPQNSGRRAEGAGRRAASGRDDEFELRLLLDSDGPRIGGGMRQRVEVGDHRPFGRCRMKPVPPRRKSLDAAADPSRPRRMRRRVRRGTSRPGVSDRPARRPGRSRASSSPLAARDEIDRGVGLEERDAAGAWRAGPPATMRHARMGRRAPGGDAASPRGG